MGRLFRVIRTRWPGLARFFATECVGKNQAKFLARPTSLALLFEADWLTMWTEVEEWDDVDTLPLPFEEFWLPKRPLAGKTKHGGYYRTTRERALRMPYIESNPLCMRSLVITDHDGGRAEEIAGVCGLPVPSYIALNPFTKSGHIVYALEAPVCLTDAARRGPVNLLSRIEAGLNDVLDGDVAFGARTTKNPRHAEHLTLWGPSYAAYKLADLAGPLAELKALPKWSGTCERRKKLANSGTGRNVDLFDTTRRWSYRRRGDFTELGVWEQTVHDHAWDRNIDTIGPAYSKGPLEDAEVFQLARSIARWTWRNIKRTFSEEQARRGQRGGIVSSRVMTEAKREANRLRTMKYDFDEISAVAREV